MSALKNRKIAILITVVFAVLATLFGVHRSLNRLTRDVEEAFYNDVVVDGQRYPGVSYYLNERADAALGLGTILEKYPELTGGTGALLSARSELISALESESIPGAHSANERMQQAFVALIENARKLDLQERDETAVDRFSSSYNGAQAAISGSLYNRKVTSYMDDASFLTHLLMPFVFVKPPLSF